MFVRPFATLFVIAALCVPAFAQEQRGSIEGIVRDASGAVLPGATVEAQSNVGPVASTTADAVGSVPFPVVASGQLQGDRESARASSSREVVDVRVALGQIKKVDFSLPLSGVDRDGAGDGGLADHRRQAERAPDEHPRRAGRTAAARPRLHDPGDAGAGRQPGEPSWAAFRSTAPAPVRTVSSSTAWRRPICRPALSGTNLDRRLRRRSPGQVERLIRRIRRRHGRRDQRRHARAAPTTSAAGPLQQRGSRAARAQQQRRTAAARRFAGRQRTRLSSTS